MIKVARTDARARQVTEARGGPLELDGRYTDAAFPAEAYNIAGWASGIAWRVLGWETAPDEDTEWSGIDQGVRRDLSRAVGVGDRGELL